MLTYANKKIHFSREPPSFSMLCCCFKPEIRSTVNQHFSMISGDTCINHGWVQLGTRNFSENVWLIRAMSSSAVEPTLGRKKWQGKAPSQRNASCIFTTVFISSLPRFSPPPSRTLLTYSSCCSPHPPPPLSWGANLTLALPVPSLLSQHRLGRCFVSCLRDAFKGTNFKKIRILEPKYFFSCWELIFSAFFGPTELWFLTPDAETESFITHKHF